MQKDNQEEQQTQPNNPFANSKLFNQTLSKMTSRYIQSKMMLSPKESSEDLKKIDLRHMCENVVHELEVVEKDAAYDYIKVSDQLKILSEEIQKSDEIMQQLQGVLYTFRDHLHSIKSEMTTLQQRSLKMNTSLSNRKKLQKMLLTFVESAVLDKQLIDAICLGTIDETYVQHIKSLLQKLNYLKNTSVSSDSKAVKQLQPELQKLKLKASTRLRQFLLDKMQLLKKPKTNIQIVQKNVLAKFKVFTQFLKDHFPAIYTEICNVYREIMAKIYLNNYKTYLGEIYKLQIQLYSKIDVLIPQDTGSMRTYLPNLKPTTFNQQKRSIFYLMNRQKILENSENQEFIHYNIANQKGQKFTMQQIFKTINKMLSDSVIFQVVFTADFFNLKSQQSIQIFGAIFKPSLNIFLQYLKNTVDQTFDVFGILLLIMLNEKNKKSFNDKSLKALDFYFDQVNMILWPRFQQLFEFHTTNIKTPNIKNYRILQKAVTYKTLNQRYIDFILGCYKIYSYFNDSKMVATRIQKLRNYYLDLIKKLAKEYDKQFDSVAYYLNILQFFYSNFTAYESQNAKKEYFDDLMKIEKEISLNVDKIVQIYMKDFFSSLYDFVKKHSKEQTESSGSNVNNDNYEEQKESTFSVQGVIDVKLLELIISEISQSFNKKIETFKTECEKIFTGFCLKSIIKRFISIFMNYYNAFFKYIKNAHPNLVGNLAQTHNMMKELKNHMKKYNI